MKKKEIEFNEIYIVQSNDIENWWWVEVYTDKRKAKREIKKMEGSYRITTKILGIKD